MAPMAPSEDFLALLPKHSAPNKLKGPIYVLWVFNPQDGSVLVDDPASHHPAEVNTHEDLAKHVPHPNRVHGYAYRIRGGWRITNADHKAVDDQYIVKQVKHELSKVK